MKKDIVAAGLMAEAAQLIKSLTAYGPAEAIFRLRALTEIAQRASTAALLDLAAAQAGDGAGPTCDRSAA